MESVRLEGSWWLLGSGMRNEATGGIGKGRPEKAREKPRPRADRMDMKGKRLTEAHTAATSPASLKFLIPKASKKARFIDG